MVLITPMQGLTTERSGERSMADNQATSGRVLTLPCVVCAKAFTYITKSKGRHARLCSPECKAVRAKRNIRAKRTVHCKACGVAFHPRQMSRAARLNGHGAYCSLACRPQCEPLPPEVLAANERRHAQTSRARVKGATIIERIEDDAIFERDGWTCGICRHPVDRALRFPDHYAVCIDHVVPLAKGGQHTEANIQCAHWLCNSMKGDRLLPSQMREGP